MKIFIAQISPKTGDLKGNTKIIKDIYNLACKQEADICLLPELALTGYFSADLFLKKSFIKEITNLTLELIKITKKTVLLITAPKVDINEKLYNAVIVAQNGKMIGRNYKIMLPNYDVFDEKRYFQPGKIPQIVNINGIKVGLPICEDIWYPEICLYLKNQGAELFLVPNASPFQIGKMQDRINVVKKRFEETHIPLIYCNQVFSQDGIVFDGRSFLYDGKLSICSKAFEIDQSMVIFDSGKFLLEDNKKNIIYSEEEEIYQTILLAIRHYVKDNGFEEVILGLSGGIDSSLVATLAADALGADKVRAIMLPSKFTSDNSQKDAIKLAKNLNIQLQNITICSMIEELSRLLNISEHDQNKSQIAYQNLQSRIRGMILMAEANKTGSLLLTTGNKSEYATGYATIYGDMNGAFNPIKDLYKTAIFKLAKYRNKISYVIPEEIINKAPSAELAANQKDSDNLPPYALLDKILEKYIENDLSQDEISQEFDSQIVSKIIKLVKKSEFKRFQAAPGVKISSKNFEKDRRYPITHFYDQ